MTIPLYSKLAVENALNSKEFDYMSLKDFTIYSQKITQTKHLDPTVIKLMFTLFEVEPWGINHLIRIISKVDFNNKDTLSKLDNGEKWFLEHFLITWVTGIYYHDRVNRVISYEGALMFSHFQHIRPTPGKSSEQFGFWSLPPKQRNNFDEH